MKSGIYIEWQGQEFSGESIGDRRWIHVPISAPEPTGEGWAANRTLRVWSKLVPASEITRMYGVFTSAKLDNVEVYVEIVDPAAREAVVRAKKGASINDQNKTPPHPLLEAVPESSYSLNWMGTVPWDRLTDVDEAVGRIDPATGEDLPDRHGHEEAGP